MTLRFSMAVLQRTVDTVTTNQDTRVSPKAVYRMAEKVNKELNLAVWRSGLKLSN